MLSADTLLPGPGRLDCEDALATCRTLMEAVPDLVLLVGRDGTVECHNRGLDSAPAPLAGSRVVDHVPGDLRQELGRSLDEIFNGAEPCARVLPARLKDGRTRWYSTRTAPVVKLGRIVGATIHARDVSETMDAERALRETEAQYRTLLEHAPEAVVILDVDEGHFVDANRKACALFGLSREALLRSDPVTLSPPLQPDGQSSSLLARDRIAKALSGESPSFEWIHRTPTGSDVPCEVRLVRLPASGRRLVRGSVTDISRQRRLEEHLQRWQRVEAVGQFASGITHEFNNLLMAIRPSTDRLIEDLADRPGLRLEAAWIKVALDRATALTNRLLAFARREQPTRSQVELDSVIRDSAGLLGRLVSPGVRLVAELNAEGAAVACDRDELDQVLMNLVLNARDAMPKGGTVTVQTTRLGEWSRGEAPADRAPVPVVQLRVKDTGMGMDESTKTRVFEAFFSTKPEGKGTGLGLSITNEIVRRAGGWIEVSSQLGVGTAFSVFLPEAPGALRTP